MSPHIYEKYGPTVILLLTDIYLMILFLVGGQWNNFDCLKQTIIVFRAL